MMTRKGRNLHADARLERLRPQISAPFPRGDRHMHGSPARIDAHFLRPQERQGTEVATAQAIRPCHLDLCIFKLGL